MSTPQTDDIARGNHVVPVEWAQQLERERDEARESLKDITEYGTEEINAAVELRQKLAQALVDLDNMQDQRDLAMKVIKRLEQERDEAREAFVIATDQMVIAQGKVREANKERDEAREKAERYRLEANAMMLQRDEARERYATEATEHMLSINRICNERDEAVEEARLLKAILDLLKKEAQ